MGYSDTERHKRDKLRFIEFIVLSVSLIGIIVAVSPSLLAGVPSPIPIPLIFILNFLILIVSFLYAYGSIILKGKVGEITVDYLVLFLGYAIGFPFGALVTEMLGPNSMYPLYTFFVATWASAVVAVLLIGRVIRHVLLDFP